MFEISDISVEYKSILHNQKEMLVTDSAHPIIAFQLSSDRRDTILRSACIKINGWEKQTDEQLGIVYEGPLLTPFTVYTVNIEAVDDAGNKAAAASSFMTGKLGTPWTAQWITSNELVVNSPNSPAPVEFKREFVVKPGIKSSYIVATAMGIFDLAIDGKRINDDYFAPGFTDYEHNLQYGYYPIKDLTQGTHTLSATVAAGWAVGRTTNVSNTNKSVSLLSAARPSLLAELTLEYRDGKKETIATSGEFQAAIDGAYKFADFYDGEIYDAAVTELKWKKADVITQRQKPKITVRYGEKVIAHEKLMPVSCRKTAAGTLIYDFGQNISGVVEFTLIGKAGKKITIRHAETLDGEALYVQNLRSAKQTIIYICKEGKQTYSPRFTYMGFQYIEVEGAAEEFDIFARAVYSDFKQIGSFSCSNKDLNQLQSNLVWSGKDNFVDIPTDCPQRDERQGWTGDIALFSETACFNFELNRFLMKWLKDMKTEQGKFGAIPFVIPTRKGVTPSITTSCWGDSCILVPYALYRNTGNKKIIREMYPVMKKYLASVNRWAILGAWKHKSKDVFALPFQFGDWCAPYGGVREWLARGPWTGTAYYSFACSLMSKIAAALGETRDAQKYREKSRHIAAAYMKKFIDENGAMPEKHEFQTGYVLPLYFKLADEEGIAKKMAANLWRMVKENGVHLNTGFTATPYLLFALADYGFAEEAYELLLQDTNPSWLYQIRKGATTTWEQWDIITESGEIKEGSMNHYAYGSVGDFFYKRICGLEAIEPGFKKFQVKPVIGGGLTFANCSHNSPYGKIAVAWERTESESKISIEVPVGTTCQVVLEGKEIQMIGSGKHEFNWK